MKNNKVVFGCPECGKRYIQIVEDIESFKEFDCYTCDEVYDKVNNYPKFITFEENGSYSIMRITYPRFSTNLFIGDFVEPIFENIIWIDNIQNVDSLDFYLDEAKNFFRNY